MSVNLQLGILILRHIFYFPRLYDQVTRLTQATGNYRNFNTTAFLIISDDEPAYIQPCYFRPILRIMNFAGQGFPKINILS